MIRILLRVLIVLLIALIGAGVWIYIEFSSTVNPKSELNVHLPPNTSLSKAIETANQAGALKPGPLYLFAAKVYSKISGEFVRAGYHRFPRGTTNFEAFRGLFSGEHIFSIIVAFPEGMEIRSFARIAARKLRVPYDEFMTLAFSPDITAEYDLPHGSVEGYLMPATYEFFPDATPETIIRKLLDKQNEIWEKNYVEKAKNAEMTRHEVLTLASIVEAESPHKDERPRVAGVYINRLERGMLLQADPTVQYAIGEKRRVLLRDLQFDSQYNTYLYQGLPPGPINSPSLESIEAVLNPERHDYIFFVAKGDGSRRHNFSRTLAEHNYFKNIFKRNVGRN